MDFRNARFRYGDGIRNLFILPILAVTERVSLLFLAKTARAAAPHREDFSYGLASASLVEFRALKVYAAGAGFETFLATKQRSNFIYERRKSCPPNNRAAATKSTTATATWFCSGLSVPCSSGGRGHLCCQAVNDIVCFPLKFDIPGRSDFFEPE